MGAVFLHGALRDPDLRRILLDRDASGVKSGFLPDHMVTLAQGGGHPHITPRAGANAVGALLKGVSAQEVERLDFYAAGWGDVPREVAVQGEDSVTHARAWFPQKTAVQPGPAFDLEEWQQHFGALDRIAATEVMEYFGSIAPDELAARMPMIRARAASRIAATGMPTSLRSKAGADDIDELASKTLHAGFYRSEERVLRHPTFTGGMSEVLHREVFVATDAALVLPYDPARDRVLLVEQFRMGPYGRGDPHPWMLEPVAGRVDAGETPEEAAHRECREEAGLTLKRLERIASYYCTPGNSTEYFHNFVGIADLPDGLPRHGGLATEAEDLRLHVLGFEAAMGLLETGEADNGPLILSLIWLARERGRLRASA